MTTERTKAAQQAIEALHRAREHIIVHTDGNWQKVDDDCTSAIAALEALTQRPAAQTWDQSADVCKGAWELGTACGKCPKCVATKPAPQQATPEPWCPDVCPITGLAFFMWIEHHKTGRMVPTYGGPYDSYTIPVRDADGSYCRERYDHDRGGWLVDEFQDVGVQIVSDQAYVSDELPDTPEPVGEVVYQIKGDSFECPHAWRDATEEAFYTTPAADRRILYTRPAPGALDDIDLTGPGCALELAKRPAPGVPDELRANVIEALREGLSVCMSVTMSRDRKIIRDGCTLYAQTEEWCRWLETEVGPQIRAVLDALAPAQAKGGAT